MPLHNKNDRRISSGGFALSHGLHGLQSQDAFPVGHQFQIVDLSVLPYPEWRETEDWDDDLRWREDRILLNSDKVVYVRPQKENGVFLLRDRKLVDGSGYCVSYCNRVPSGTAYTVRYALQHGVKVFNASSFDVRSLLR